MGISLNSLMQAARVECMECGGTLKDNDKPSTGHAAECKRRRQPAYEAGKVVAW